MLPSARRAELSREYFDNSYLSRKAFEGGGGGGAAADVAHPVGAPLGQDHVYHHPRAGGGVVVSGGLKPPLMKGTSAALSRTTAGLTTFEDDVDDSGFGASGDPSDYGGGETRSKRDISTRTASPFKDVPEYESYSSEDDSLGSMMTADSRPVSARAPALDPVAGEIWGMLRSLDDLVLEVKGNICQCQRLGARLAALKKPMLAVHRGKQTADQDVLCTIRDLVAEAQQFMQRFLDPEWWRNRAGHKEESEMFRELTFRLGFLMQAPPGFQRQSHEEDEADRTKDSAELKKCLEDKLRSTRDEQLANEIMQVLSRLRMRRVARDPGSCEIDYGSLVLTNSKDSGRSPVILGNGGFGTVYAATLDAMPVVVKQLNNQSMKQELLEGIRREVQAFHNIEFDFVVRTLGACTMRPKICIVQERAQASLFSILHEPGLYMPLSVEEKAAMLYDLARGLQYLHVKKICHGNLKSPNVLVFENNRLKVSDFGLIAVRESQAVPTAGDVVPSAAWTAPELLDDQDPSVLSDMYSFGILIHEVLTQRIPFAGKSMAKITTAVVAKGHRPGYIEGEEETFPRGLTKLADVCWTQQPAARPKSLTPIVTELGHIVRALGGDPRPRPKEQAAGGSAANTPKSLSASATPARQPHRGTSRAHMTEQERRIQDLEEELRLLKMGATGSEAGDSRQSICSVDQLPGGWHQKSMGGGVPVVPGVTPQVFGVEKGIPEERNALRALYTATQGPAWFEQSGWETNDPDLSKWYGVVCGEGGHVTGLQLPSNNLQGPLPFELAALSRVKAVVLANNFLEGPIPPTFGSLGRLAELDLSMNDFTGSIPSSLSNAASLERLQLQCNGLTGNVPRTLQKLHNLKIFNADWRDLCDTHPYRKIRKMSPAPTPEEVARARSESRKSALKRSDMSARLAAGAPASSDGRSAASGSATSSPGGFNLRPASAASPSRRATPTMAEPNRSAPRFGILNRSRATSAASPGFSGGRRQTNDHGASGGRRLTDVGGGGGGDDDPWGGGNEESNPRFDAHAAPTAPYVGQDGIHSAQEAKAKAAAAAAAPPPRSWKKSLASVGKALAQTVGADLHPGYTDENAVLKK